MCGHSRNLRGPLPTPDRSIFFFCNSPARTCLPQPVSLSSFFSVKDGTQIKTFLGALQFTKRRMRTFITIPSARNVNITEEPP
jgi:hypothetical protein